MSRPPVYCTIYEDRPDHCINFPAFGKPRPDTCGFELIDRPFESRCNPNCLASCCLVPREEGQPDGIALPFAEGGRICRHLAWPPELEDAVLARAEGMGKIVVGRGVIDVK